MSFHSRIQGKTLPLVVAAVATTLAAVPGFAQKAAAGDELTEVVVTGSRIKGAQPVGSAVVTVGRKELEEIGAQTVQQVLKTVPAVVGLNSAGQGSFGSADGAGTNAPTIHGLGASASNSTLILINGHRFPLSGINHTLGDPNIIAPLALERVEVLADGASSVYGSDAVAGVINFTTRRRYEGVEFTAQKGFGNQYNTFSAGVLAGKRWDSGAVLVSYSHSNRDNLNAGDRAFTRADHRAQGGTNQATFNCAPATITPAGSTLVFSAPYNTPGVANTAANFNCDFSGLTDLLPREKRHNFFVSVEQELSDKLKISGDFVYSRRNNRQNVARGGVQATIFGPGYSNAAQINPFFQLPAGTTATSATVRFQADDLLGPGAHIDSGAETTYTLIKGNYEINDSWNAEVGTVLGRDKGSQQNFGQLCVSCAYLAINGTTNGGGSVTTPSIPGTTTPVLQLPLNASNALDVFNLLGANRTSAAVRAALTDSAQLQIGDQSLTNFFGTVTGTLGSVGGGDAKVAIGVEYLKYSLDQHISRPTNSGPASVASQQINLAYNRDVKSAFAEVLLPFVTPQNAMPGVNRLEANLSARTDRYSDFGGTNNPKVALNWEPVGGLKFRANWGKSFVAPALTSIGSDDKGTTGESSFGNYGLGAINVPVANFPLVAQLPGCAGLVTCTLGSGALTGAQINGGNPTLVAQKGKTYGLGFDWTPEAVRGLAVSATYWNNKLTGGVTAPVPAFALNTAALANLLTIYPGGASAAQIAAARGNLTIGSALPTNIYFIYNYQQRNVLNLNVTGVDLDVRYSFETAMGKISTGAGLSRKLKFDQSVGVGGQVFDVLGTAGFNTTFPSLKTEARANLGWKRGPINTMLYVNYTGGYTNWSAGAVNPVVRTNGVPTSGGDPVKSNTTVDLNLSYELDGRFKGTSVFVDGTNLLDKDPPFYNSANGYDSVNASPIGRVITVGVRAKL